MKPGVSWNVRGVRPEAQETALEAARRSGLSIGDWLNSVIIDSVEVSGSQPKRRPDLDDKLDWKSRRPRRPHGQASEALPSKHEPRKHRQFRDEPPRRDRPHEAFESVNQRLDGLTRQLDRLAKLDPAATIPARKGPVDETSRQLASAISRLDSRLDRLISEGRHATSEIERRVSAVDRTLASFSREAPRPYLPEPTSPIEEAIAEIVARQRELDHAPSHSRLPEAPRYSAPVARTDGDDLSGLQKQLQQLTTHIEALRRPCGVEKAVAGLRGDLGEIGRTLREAMPRRAVEALEAEVRKLAERLMETRQTGADGKTLTSIELGLGEVRDALRSLTPAESLVGFEQAVKVLSQKIDVVSSSSQDPGALQQIETAITGLRGIVSHVASNESLAKLAEEVRTLGAKVEGIAAGRQDSAAMATLEQRVASLTDVLQTRGPAEVADAPQLDAIVKSLAEKIERIHLSRGDQTAFGHLEDRIVKLVEKLDASDARLSQLEVIERGLAELLIHLEGLRAGGPAPAVEGIKRDLEELRETERRTQDSLELMHGTLGHVVDRLAMLETDIRSAPEAPADRPTAPPAHAAPPRPTVAAATATAAQPSVAPPPRPLPAVIAPIKVPQAAAERRPIDPNLPPDHPLEPGVARGRASPADRIAASEAALGSAKPPVIADPGPKSNFIAAARRAAQSAAAAQRDAAVEPSYAALVGDAPLSRRLAQHAKSLLVGGSVVVLALGTWHIATTFFDQTDPPALQMPDASAKDAPDSQSSRSPTPVMAPVLGQQSGLVPNGDTTISGAPPSGLIMPPEPARAASPILPPPAAPKASPDVTGSLPPRSVALPAPAAPFAMPSFPVPSLQIASAGPQGSVPGRSVVALASPAAAPLGSDKLPVGIGGPALRNAAAAGDATAQYEVASRYADGRGVPASLEEAVRWYERAAEQGIVPAQFRLGSLYEKGQGVKKDLDTARRLYVEAAGKGHAKAMHNLAVLYAEGIDGKPDFRMAAEWFRKGADRGVTDSEYNLGILYARGIGLEQNLGESFKWFSLAAQQGDKDAAKKRDDVAARLDPQSLTAAKLAIQTWAAVPQPDEAVTVKTPPGGWDSAAADPKAKRK